MEQHLVIVIAFFLFSIHMSKGGLNQLCILIGHFNDKVTGAECLSYDDYGCWCGIGGSGKPVDNADHCCKKHDSCYDAILSKNQCSPYFKQYTVKNGTCLDLKGTCLRRTCECDRDLAICLSQQEFQWGFWGHRFWPGNCED